ncbi:MAG TPA: FAD-binding oxidoreductase [Kiloniellaceae bacterium]|nr:FAD-binding oxidoreductase [Kiloniellaceae bacterium]
MGEADPGTNLWSITAGETLAAEPLEGDARADAVIVGGGFTGCSAALHLAEAGMGVRLLEAQSIGFGGSGRNVGLVNAGLWLPPEEVEQVLGQAVGGRLNAALAAGPDLVFSLIDRLGIDCEATRSGTLHCAHSQGGLDELKDRLRQLLGQGAPVELLNAEETAARTGTQAYRGALLDRRAGTIQPLAYCRGLARAARDAGAMLHERTPVVSVARSGDGWRVTAPGGSVSAGALLIAVNAYGRPMAGLTPPSYVPVHYFQIATRPLTDNLRRSVLPERQGCWDTAPVMSSFRLDAAGRLLIGAVGSLEGPGARWHRAWAERKLAALFPDVAGIDLEHAWCGRIAMTGDHLPKILRLGERGVSVFGYSGRGISPGTTFGKALAAYLVEGDERALPCEAVDAHSERLAGVKQAYYEFGASLTHAVGER